MRMLWRLSLAVGLTAPPAMAMAQSCVSPASSAFQQALSTLPKDLQALLAQHGAAGGPACTAPQPHVIQTGFAPPPVTRPQAPAAVLGPIVADEVLVTVQGGEGEARAVAAANGLAVVSLRTSLLLGDSLVRYRIPDGRPPARVLADLVADPRVTDFEVNHIYDLQQTTAAAPPRFELETIALGATDRRFTGKGVRVALIDSGVDDQHPALAGAIAASFDALREVPVNDRRHGTAIAGLIAGRGELGSVAPAALLLVARAFDVEGAGAARSRSDALLEALDWAVTEKAAIINMSFAGPRNRLLTRALAAAHARGIVLIASSGNNGPGAPYAYPAAEPGVLAITATDSRNMLYAEANRGPYVFAAAPGVEVLAPVPGGMDLMTGTSFAAGLASGIAALILEADPKATPDALAGRIARTAKDLGAPGRDAEYGVGLVSAAAALP